MSCARLGKGTEGRVLRYILLHAVGKAEDGWGCRVHCGRLVD